MASRIQLRNNLITVHNGGTLSASPPQKAVKYAHYAGLIGTNTTSITTVEDISSWSVGDTVIFTPTIDSLSMLYEKTIKSIDSNNVFTIDTPIDPILDLSALPVNVPHIFNISNQFVIGGKDSVYRGAMRVLDSAKVDIAGVEFQYWGIPSDPTSNGIVLIGNNTNTANISSCTLNNDNAINSRFIVARQDSNRDGVFNLNFQNNIIYNTGERSVVYNLTTPLSAQISLYNNIFLNGSVWLLNLSSNSLDAKNSIFIRNKSVWPSLYADCENILQCNFSNINLHANSDGIHLYRLHNTTLSAVTSLYSEYRGITLEEPSNIIVKDIDISYSESAGVYIHSSKDSLLVQNLTSTNNNIFNLLIDHTTPTDNISVSTIDSFLSGSDNGFYYIGNAPLYTNSVTSINNRDTSIYAFLESPPTTINSGMTAIDNYISNSNTGLCIYTTNSYLLTPNNLSLSGNNIDNNNIGIDAVNVAGKLIDNSFDLNQNDFKLTLGNDTVTVSGNVAVTHPSFTNYKHLHIPIGTNYKGIDIHTNTVYLSGFSLQSAGINLLKHAGSSVLNSWPSNGVVLKLQYGTGETPNINKESILFYYTTPGINYFRIVYSGPAFSANTWRTAVYKNDTLVKILPVKSNTKIKLPPTTNTTQTYNKFLLSLEKISTPSTSLPYTVEVNIQKIQYSYDDITYFDLDVAAVSYDNTINFSGNTNPETYIAAQGIKDVYTNLLTLGNTNFKNFKIYNSQSPEYMSFNILLENGPIMGSYIVDGVSAAVNPLAVQSFYQTRAEKSTGIVITNESNVSSYFKNGYILKNNVNSTSINEQNNAPSETMHPSTTSKNKLKSSRKYVAVRANESTTVYTYVKTSKLYNGKAPRLMVSKNTTLGILEDTVLDTHTNSYGIWSPLSGTTVHVSKNGVLEFYVDCDGTAGSVAIDSWAAPIRNVSGPVAISRVLIKD